MRNLINNSSVALVVLASICGLLTACGGGTPGVGDLNVPGIRVSPQTMSRTDQIEIEQVYSRGPGWILIRQAIEDPPNSGQFRPADTVIGRQQVVNGLSENLIVDVSLTASDRQYLFAMLHVDEPAIGVFNALTDVQARDSSGAPIQRMFEISLRDSALTPRLTGPITASLTSQILIDEVRVDRDAWLVVRDDSGLLGTERPIVGLKQLSRGVHGRVRVDLMDLNTQRPFRLRDQLAKNNLIAYLYPDQDGAPDLSSFPLSDVLRQDIRWSENDGDGNIADIRFVVRATSGTLQYQFVSVEPEYYRDLVLANSFNPQVTMLVPADPANKLRYEFVFMNNDTHPFEFLYDYDFSTNANAPTATEVLFTQVPRQGERYFFMNTHRATRWGQVSADNAVYGGAGDTYRFNLMREGTTTALWWPGDILNRYRCSAHPTQMAGQIRLQDEASYSPNL